MPKNNLFKIVVYLLFLFNFPFLIIANIPVSQQQPQGQAIQYQNQTQNQNYYNKEETERRETIQHQEIQPRQQAPQPYQNNNNQYNREEQYNRQPVNNYQYNRPNLPNQQQKQSQEPNMELRLNKEEKKQSDIIDDIKTKHGEAIITKLPTNDSITTDTGKTDLPKSNGLEVPANTKPVQTNNYQTPKVENVQNGINAGKYIAPATYEKYNSKSAIMKPGITK